MVKRLLIAYFIGNISAKKCQNQFMCIKVMASQRWDVFFETWCRYKMAMGNLRNAKCNSASR